MVHNRSSKFKGEGWVVCTIKSPIFGPLIFGHLPQPDGYNLNNFDIYSNKAVETTLINYTLLVLNTNYSNIAMYIVSWQLQYYLAISW